MSDQERFEVLIESWAGKVNKFRNVNVVKDLGLRNRYDPVVDSNGNAVLNESGKAVVVLTTAAEQATALLSVYQSKQVVGKTAHLIHRAAGTRSYLSIWVIGHRSADAIDLFKQAESDFTNRIMKTVKPILMLIAGRNRQARAKVDVCVEKIEQALAELGGSL